MIISADQFWVVWRLSTGHLNKRHMTLDSAEKEAHRLAQAEPKEIFYVLTSVQCHSSPLPTKRNVYEWRYWYDDGTGIKEWKVAKKLMNANEAYAHFTGVQYEQHAGPFKVEE